MDIYFDREYVRQSLQPPTKQNTHTHRNTHTTRQPNKACVRSCVLCFCDTNQNAGERRRRRRMMIKMHRTTSSWFCSSLLLACVIGASGSNGFLPNPQNKNHHARMIRRPLFFQHPRVVDSSVSFRSQNGPQRRIRIRRNPQLSDVGRTMVVV